MKVANIIEESRVGGPQLRIAKIAKKLSEHGIETIVIFPKKESKDFANILKNSNISYKLLPIRKLTKKKRELIKYFLFFFYELFIILKYLKNNNFNIVHVSGGAWQFKGAIAGKLSGAKVIWHLNDTSMPLFIRILFKPIAHFFADSFIVAGTQVKNYYFSENYVSKKIYTIGAPVDCEEFNPKLIKPDLQISNTKGTIKIGVVANISPIKGLEYFIEMASILEQLYGQKLEFWIIGNCFQNQESYANMLQQKIEKLCLTQLKFYGACDDVKRVLKALDIYVCSSIAEASPTIVWEAMAMKKPIVSTNVGDVFNILHNGNAGFTVPIRSGEKLATAVKTLIEDSRLREEFSENARNVALQELDIHFTTEKHFNAYKEAMSQKFPVFSNNPNNIGH